MSQVSEGNNIENKKDKKSYWRSFGELLKTKTYSKFMHREFQEDASEISDPTRRKFIKLMGASAAFAGVAGCGLRKPVQKIYPYAKMPEHLIPGKANYYATTMVLGQQATGLLVESHEGRPTKIEGNPLHSVSGGAASTFHQASVLNLYDPDRLKHPQHLSKEVSKEALISSLNSLGKSALGKKGKGFAILTQSEVSPSFYQLISKLKAAMPNAKVYRYDPVNQDNVIEGVRLASAVRALPEVDFEKADIVLSLESDFLAKDVYQLSNSKGFAKRRDPEHKNGMNRLYQLESQYTVTGGKADHRFRVKSGDVFAALCLISQELFKRVSVSADLRESVNSVVAQAESVLTKKEVSAIAKDLLSKRGKSVVVAGANQGAEVHALTYALNKVLANLGQTVDYHKVPFSSYKMNIKSSSDSIAALASDLEANKLDTLVILGGNPRFDAPSDLNMGPKFKKAETVLHLTESANETSELAQWVIPQSHYLETWGDAVALNGTSSVIQPLINPMYDSLSSIELISHLLGYNRSAYATVRRNMRAKYKTDFNQKWKQWLHDGVLPVEASSDATTLTTAKLSQKIKQFKSERHSDIELVFSEDSSLYDGRFANNSWLQEAPDPITKLTWDNAALMSPKTALKLGLPELTGLAGVETVFQNPLPMISIKVGKRNLDVVAFIVPGHADNSIALSLGYGRKKVGRVGENTGFNTYYVRSSTHFNTVPSVSVQASGKSYEVASTQEHGSMEERPLIASATADYYKAHQNFAEEMEEAPPLKSLWDEVKYDKGYQWGMAIDLSKCTGCNACVIACQSENNIPVVGKDEVINGREMHWIRMDRYFEGEKDDPNPKMVNQPMTCLHCENAPCEQVCPVAATTHSEDGLNQMTYNRCIGTRYCSNNCPVKVRRFNFFDYHQKNPQAVKKHKEHLFDHFKEPEESVKLQMNPDVTVRMRGVMEKCTFCVQRVSKARINAKVEGRAIQDGEVKPACAQTCAADAIVFGDINDPNTEVSKVKEKRNYNILKGLHLKARTSYLALVTNPNPKLVDKNNEKQHAEAHS